MRRSVMIVAGAFAPFVALALGLSVAGCPLVPFPVPDPALPRFPRRLEPLPIDDGPHLSYAIQWFSFALMAIVFGVVILKTKGVSGEEKA